MDFELARIIALDFYNVEQHNLHIALAPHQIEYALECWSSKLDRVMMQNQDLSGLHKYISSFQTRHIISCKGGKIDELFVDMKRKISSYITVPHSNQQEFSQGIANESCSRRRFTQAYLCNIWKIITNYQSLLNNGVGINEIQFFDVHEDDISFETSIRFLHPSEAFFTNFSKKFKETIRNTDASLDVGDSDSRPAMAWGTMTPDELEDKLEDSVQRSLDIALNFKLTVSYWNNSFSRHINTQNVDAPENKSAILNCIGFLSVFIYFLNYLTNEHPHLLPNLEVCQSFLEKSFKLLTDMSTEYILDNEICSELEDLICAAIKFNMKSDGSWSIIDYIEYRARELHSIAIQQIVGDYSHILPFRRQLLQERATKADLLPNIIQESSVKKWIEKFTKFPTLQQLMKNSTNQECNICKESLQIDNVAILPACDHINCANCMEKWFSGSSSATS